MVTSLLFPLSLLFLLSSFGHGSASNEELIQLLKFDGCPLEARDHCTQLEMGTDPSNKLYIDCPHKLWYGKPQLIFHTASNTTSVSTVWHPTIKVYPMNDVHPMMLYRKFNETHGDKMEPGMKIICSKDVPEISLEAFMKETWGSAVITYFCSRKEQEILSRLFASFGTSREDEITRHGYCTMEESKPRKLQCHTGWWSEKCDRFYEPFNPKNSDESMIAVKPHAVEDTCNIALAEGCPDQAENDCIKLQFVEEGSEQLAYCPRKLWLSTDFYDLTNPWEEIDKLSCKDKRWKIKSRSASNGAFLDPLRRVRCARTQPTSRALQLIVLVAHSIGYSDLSSTIFCYNNQLRCVNGGHCMMALQDGDVKASFCSCDSEYFGNKCDMKKPEASMMNRKALSLLDVCPYEESGTSCQQLSFASADTNGKLRVVCQHKLWRSHLTQSILHMASNSTSFTTTWLPIDRISRHYDLWYFGYPNQTGDYALKDGEIRVICSKEMPDKITLEGFTSVTWGVRINESLPFKFCSAETGKLKSCKHGYCSEIGTNPKNNPVCRCHFGYRGDLCDTAFDPYGYEKSTDLIASTRGNKEIWDFCNILLAEGCPDEENGDCLKLRFIMDNGVKQVHCPRKLWLSNNREWESIDNLVCENDKSWKIGSKASSNGTILRPHSRVRCAHEMPATPFYDLQRAIQHYFGQVDIASTFFCFRNSLKCENGGQCLHTIRNNEMRTYCSCGLQYSGDRCEIAKPDAFLFSSCSPLLVEGCAYEAKCEILQFDATSQAAICLEPNSLWASDVQLVYNSYTLTHSTSSNWTIIDKLWCKDKNWQISREGQETTLTLGRKVVCAKSPPQYEADAFWEHRSFILNSSNFALVKPGPLAFCTDEVWESKCHSERSYCVLSYKDEKFVPSCYCDFGYAGEHCWSNYDPYGFQKIDDNAAEKSGQKPDTVVDSCNILLAEGCPDMFYDNCAKLRYYDSAVICRRKLWVSKSYARSEWEQIDGLKCTKEGLWEIHKSSKKEVLDIKMRVQCNWNTPGTILSAFNSEIRPYWDEEEGEMTTELSAFFCMWNKAADGKHYCQNGNQCILKPNTIADWQFDGVHVKKFSDSTTGFYCWCNQQLYTGEDGPFWGYKYYGKYCEHLNLGLPVYHDLPPGYHGQHGSPAFTNKHGVASVHREDHAKIDIEICDPSDLEDGCNNKNCKKLKANSTHVKCSEQLWLNYGNEFLLDWHEISGVKCTNNEWKSECSKKIGRSHLICSSSHPSSISSHLWMLFGVAGLVIIIAIGLTCVVCLMTRRRRKVAQVLADARTPHSSRCVSSTQNSEMTTREEE